MCKSTSVLAFFSGRLAFTEEYKIKNPLSPPEITDANSDFSL